MDLQLRQARFEDIPSILEIYRDASKQMALMGIDQWQNGYPNQELLEDDIKRQESFVLCDGHVVVASAMVSSEKEISYDTIDGAWHHAEPYYVVHRFCVSTTQTRKGYAQKMMHAILEHFSNPVIRIDTHLDNQPMLAFLEGFGFQRAGLIRLHNSIEKDPIRVAYDYHKKESE